MNKELREYSIPVVWSMWGRLKIKAYSEEEAREIAFKPETPLPEDSGYLDDSFEIDEEGEIESHVINPDEEDYDENNNLSDDLSQYTPKSE